MISNKCEYCKRTKNKLKMVEFKHNLLYSKINMARKPRILTAEDVIHELEGDNYILELDDPQEPVMPGSDDNFSNLEDINEDDEEGNYIDINNKVISVFSIYQYSNFFILFF